LSHPHPQETKRIKEIINIIRRISQQWKDKTIVLVRTKKIELSRTSFYRLVCANIKWNPNKEKEEY
jgi:hypothetical protein